MRSNPTKHLIDYLDAQGIELPKITESNTIDDEAPELPKGMSFKNVINNPVVGDEKPAPAPQPTVGNPMGPTMVKPIPEVKPTVAQQPVVPQNTVVNPQPVAPNATVPNGINSIFAGTQNNG